MFSYASHAAHDLLDIDKDGKLSMAEHMAGFGPHTDHDGYITQEELDGKMLTNTFSLAHVNTDNDGIIIRREHNVALDTLNIDKDYPITGAELAQASHAAFEFDAD